MKKMLWQSELESDKMKKDYENLKVYSENLERRLKLAKEDNQRYQQSGRQKPNQERRLKMKMLVQ